MILPSGIKGIFYAALFATILSTANSFLFLSGTTISRDFIYKLSKVPNDKKLKSFTIIGLLISGIMSVILAYLIPSVIEIWYTIGSICIPGMIIPVVSSYYDKFKINEKLVLLEMTMAVSGGFTWFLIRTNLTNPFLSGIEPMIVGLLISIMIHAIGLVLKFVPLEQRKQH
jgi:SSS family solute:Na+ symporter